MIVRIMGHGQWVLDPEHLMAMNELDRALEEKVEAGDAEGMKEALAALNDGIRRLGVEVPDDVIVESDLVLPDVDISLEEVKALLDSTSEYYGLIPDAEDELSEQAQDGSIDL